MPTEGVSEANRALLHRIDPTLLEGPFAQATHWKEFNRLLDAARAEGPTPGTTTYSEPEVEEDDGVVTVRAFSTDKLRVVSFAVHPNHVLKVTTPGSAERLERPAPPGGAETALRKLLAPADLHHVADHERLRLSSRRFDLGLTIGELRAALTQPETPDHG